MAAHIRNNSKGHYHPLTTPQSWWSLWFVCVLLIGQFIAVPTQAAEPHQASRGSDSTGQHGAPYKTLPADEYVFSSGPRANVMVELYTSEGCSSCPPAEEYLNSLSTHPDLWKSVFPMAFHVDYWNHLGWRDRFSRAAYSERQRSYARQRNTLFIYTPQILVNGNSWRPGRFKQALPQQDNNVTGSLEVIISGNSIRARYSANESQAGKHRPRKLHIAIVGMGLISAIKAGENTGRAARHDFVVLAHSEHNSNTSRWNVPLPTINSHGEIRRAVIAWVSVDNNPAPIQVTGGHIDNK